MSIASRLSRGILASLGVVASSAFAADVPRIVSLDNIPSSSFTTPIREPQPLSAVAPPTESRLRGAFVPISLPGPAPAVPSLPAPELAQRPDFARPETGPESSQATGPVLAPPTANMTIPPALAAPAEISNQRPIATVPTPAAVVSQPTLSFPQQVPAAQAPDARAMQAVVQRAMEKADVAATMAQRGMLYSARTELIQALQLIVHGLDAQSDSTIHAQSLAAGLLAIEEARDFATQPSGPKDAREVHSIAASHRTPVLQAAGKTVSSPLTAQQNYLEFSKSCLIEAAGTIPAASQILYRLGRLETAMAAHDADPLALHGPQAIVFHQAALATDGRNWLAANELGVLFARYGQLEIAKDLLLTSLGVHPHIEGWHNLATIHRRLGEVELAQRAENERRLLAARPGAAATNNDTVRWVDSKTFAAGSAADVHWPAEVANKARR